MESTKKFGLLAEFDSTAALYHACEKVRDAGYTKWDAHSPFPIHGLDKAMGLGASRVPWIVLGTAALGGIGIFGLQAWINLSEYPVILSGKPYFSWPAFVPVTFALTILSAAFAAIFGTLHLNKLPRFHHPVFSSERFKAFSTDKFFISIENADPKFGDSQTESLLRQAGAKHIEPLFD